MTAVRPKLSKHVSEPNPETSQAELDTLRHDLDSRPLKSPHRGARGVICTTCGNPTMNWSETLTLEWDDEGERVHLENLTGLLCDTCGEKAFDMPASRIVGRVIDRQRAKRAATAKQR